MARTVARRTPDLPDWQRNREVQRLTREILALQHDVAAKVVAAVAEMGTRMRQIRAALEHGQWLSWVQTAVPFDARTITRAMRLSEWAEAEPRELARLEHLGPTKLSICILLRGHAIDCAFVEHEPHRSHTLRLEVTRSPSALR